MGPHASHLAWSLRLLQDGRIRCALCLRALPRPAFPAWTNHGKLPWACKPCWLDYIRFRRAFRAEHGRWPILAEFRAEEDAA